MLLPALMLFALFQPALPLARLGRVFRPSPFPRVSSLKAHEGAHPFAGLGLQESSLAALAGMKIVEPSPIQRLALPRLLKGENAVLAAGTGSGKTLAYLLPVVEHLKTEEFSRDAEGMATLRRPKRPRALVLVPTRELAMQVAGTMKELGHYVKLSSTMVIGGDQLGKQKKLLDRPIDVLVASPGRLIKMRDAGNVFLGSVKHVVVDEVDTMLTQGFAPELDQLLGNLLRPRDGRQPQYICATATITKALRQELKEIEGRWLPSLSEIQASDLHRSSPTVRHEFRDLKGQDKIAALRDVLGQHKFGAQRRQERTMVFCNNVKSAQAVAHALREAGFNIVSYHAEMPSDLRRENLLAFTEGRSARLTPREAAKASGEDLDSVPSFIDDVAFDEGSFPILVCTDIAARGLDIAQVKHVVNFDFPRNSVDYLHRAGRTGRLNADGSARAQRGMVTSLVGRRDRTLAAAIDRSLSAGEDLEQSTGVDADHNMGSKMRAARLREARLAAKRAQERKARDEKADRRGRTSKMVRRKRTKK